MVFDTGQERENSVRSRSIDRLKEPGREDPVIDDGPAPGEFGRTGGDASPPLRASEGIEMLRVLVDEQRFRLAITRLLSEVVRNGRTPVMPHKGGRCETDLPAAPLDAPTDVDIIPGLPEDHVEAPDVIQALFSKGHIATWDVLRETVGQHDVGRTPG
jgi:hypothetical protein